MPDIQPCNGRTTVYKGPNEPNPVRAGDIWINTSVTPHAVNQYGFCVTEAPPVPSTKTPTTFPTLQQPDLNLVLLLALPLMVFAKIWYENRVETIVPVSEDYQYDELDEPS